MVLTEDTGFARRYTDDPYGSYSPRRGYYASDNTMFAPLAEDDREAAKTVVLGARTDEGAIAFNKDRLLESRVLEGTLAGRAVLAVADPRLATGYVYAHPSDVTVQLDGTDYRVTGADEPQPADELPLERILSFDAMWFAWAGFYPDTTYVE